VRRAIELVDLLAAELERREPFDFEAQMTVPPRETFRVH
jgi:hypothetical protein